MTSAITTSTVSLPDGRSLEVASAGVDGGPALLYHGGSPSAAVLFEPLVEAVTAAGMRVVTYARPGYGDSSPRRPEQGAPVIADDVADAVEVLDALGIDDFVTLGWSGGGPRALATAALLPERCRAATSVAGIAPLAPDDATSPSAGLSFEDWSGEMGPENVLEYTTARRGREAYEALLGEMFAEPLPTDPALLAEAMGGLLTDVDRRALQGDGGFAGFLATIWERAQAQGVVGVCDDGLAAVAPWGVDVTAIEVPVAVWQGDADAMVPMTHGRWLAEHVPGAVAHLQAGEGHLSVLHPVEMLEELRGLEARR